MKRHAQRFAHWGLWPRGSNVDLRGSAYSARSTCRSQDAKTLVLDCILPRFEIKDVPEDALQDFSLMVDLPRRNNLQFDAVLGAKIAREYKPKPRVYLTAAEAFGLASRECMMVSAAAHSSDILGAGAAGLRSATVGRPDELGPGTAVTVPKKTSTSSPRICMTSRTAWGRRSRTVGRPCRRGGDGPGSLGKLAHFIMPITAAKEVTAQT